VEVPAGGHLRVTLDDLDNLGANEIYLRRGGAPSAGTYDYRFSKLGADQVLLVPDAGAGDWHILVVGANVTGSGDYTLRADFLTGIPLQSVSPGRIGNLTPATLVVDGAGFANTAQAFLKLGTSTVRTGTISLVSGSRLLVEFNFVGVLPNRYQVTINQGTNSASLPLEVVEGGSAMLETQFIVPQAVGRHVPATLIVEYANTGDVAHASLRSWLSTAADDALLTLDSSIGAQDCGPPPATRFSDTVQFIGSGAVGGISPTCERLRALIYYSGLATRAFSITQWSLIWVFSTSTDSSSSDGRLTRTIFGPTAQHRTRGMLSGRTSSRRSG
jgi:hypothetical protein